MFDNKNILITGGTGSFGRKYTEIILSNYKPNKLKLDYYEETIELGVI